jgi:hypothetical protein
LFELDDEVRRRPIGELQYNALSFSILKVHPIQFNWKEEPRLMRPSFAMIHEWYLLSLQRRLY